MGVIPANALEGREIGVRDFSKCSGDCLCRLQNFDLPACREAIEDIGAEVDAVGPDNGSSLGFQLGLFEESHIR